MPKYISYGFRLKCVSPAFLISSSVSVLNLHLFSHLKMTFFLRKRIIQTQESTRNSWKLEDDLKLQMLLLVLLQCWYYRCVSYSAGRLFYFVNCDILNYLWLTATISDYKRLQEAGDILTKLTASFVLFLLVFGIFPHRMITVSPSTLPDSPHNLPCLVP